MQHTTIPFSTNKKVRPTVFELETAGGVNQIKIIFYNTLLFLKNESFHIFFTCLGKYPDIAPLPALPAPAFALTSALFPLASFSSPHRSRLTHELLA